MTRPPYDVEVDDRPNLTRTVPNMLGRGLPLPPRLPFLVLLVALVAFVTGLQMRPNLVPVVTPSAASAPSSARPIVPPTPELIATPPPTSMPVGVYHLSETLAEEVAIASRFYASYNAHDLPAIMTLLSETAKLVDCDYASHSTVTIDGRSAIETYFRARFADHDHWIVEFFNENPEEALTVVVLPTERASDTLRRLGAIGGAKRSFQVAFYLQFAADHVHLDQVNWNTMPNSVETVCSP